MVRWEARASLGGVAVLVLRTPTRGIAGTRSQATGDKIASPSDAKPVLFVQQAPPATRQLSRVSQRARRAVSGGDA